MKQTLLFIHGFRGNHLGLEEIAKNFSSKKDYDILIPDIPPAGKNDLPEYSARHYARFIANYIKKNKLKKPILIGHSMGTIVAAAVAERYPDLINKKIIFLSPISTKPNNFLAILTPLTAILPNKIIGFISSKYTHVKASGKPIREILQTTYLCGADYVSKKAVYQSAKFSVSSAISDFEFNKKALFLAGERDRLIPHNKTKQVAKKFKAQVVFIKDTGHLLNYEKPKEVAKIIKKFLKS